METIIFLLQFIFTCIAVGVFVLVIYFLWDINRDYRRKKRYDENRYDMLYLHIKAFVEKDCSRSYFNYIMEKLIDLGQLKYKNREKTEVLTCTFLDKYKKYMQELPDGSCDFNFDQLDSDELVKRLKIQNEANKL